MNLLLYLSKVKFSLQIKLINYIYYRAISHIGTIMIFIIEKRGLLYTKILIIITIIKILLAIMESISLILLIIPHIKIITFNTIEIIISETGLNTTTSSYLHIETSYMVNTACKGYQ